MTTTATAGRSVDEVRTQHVYVISTGRGRLEVVTQTGWELWAENLNLACDMALAAASDERRGRGAR